jgi:hypothetical protein
MAIKLTQTQLRILTASNVGALAINDRGTVGYIGHRTDTNIIHRNTLTVQSLDASGNPFGAPMLFRDSADELAQFIGNNYTISQIVQHASHLYVCGYENGDPGHDRQLSVWSLDSDGLPTGAPVNYHTNLPGHAATALALSSDGTRLYVVGQGSAGVSVYALNASGDPTGSGTYYAGAAGRIAYGAHAVSVSADGSLLYYGTYPQTLVVIPLSSGVPQMARATAYACGAETVYLQFLYTSRGLYFRKLDGGLPFVAYLPLDSSGTPTGSAVTTTIQLAEASTFAGEVPVRVFGVDVTAWMLWACSPTSFTDAATGNAVTDGLTLQSYPIDSAGAPGASSSSVAYPRVQCAGLQVDVLQRPVFITSPIVATGHAASDPFICNRVTGQFVRATITAQAGGTAPFTVEYQIPGVAGRFNGVWLGLTVGVPSPAVSLDAALQNNAAYWELLCVVQGASLASLTFQIDLCQGDPAAGGTVLKSFTETVVGNWVWAALQGYGYEPYESRLSACVPGSEYIAHLHAAADAVALSPTQRPALIPIYCHNVYGEEGHLGALQDALAIVSEIGFNMAAVETWQGLQGTIARAEAVTYGVAGIGQDDAGFDSPHIFDYQQNAAGYAAAAATAMRAIFTSQAVSQLPQNSVYTIDDEPGWDQKVVITGDGSGSPNDQANISSHSAYRTVWQTWLQANSGYQPVDLQAGATSWTDLVPVSRSVAIGGTLTQRRLFYWTIRFFSAVYAQRLRNVRAALETAAGNPLLCPVTNTVSLNWQYQSRSASGDAAEGRPDFFAVGRLSATELGAEDHFGDHKAYWWAAMADWLRSCASLGDRGHAPVLIGGNTGNVPGGTALKVFSILARQPADRKIVSWASWGPDIFIHFEFAEQTNVYGPMASTHALVAACEHFLQPGIPGSGKVAILLPWSAYLWDPDMSGGPPQYLMEVWGLHTALVHQGYAVDFVDEVGIASGILGRNGYLTLYVTAPNISRAAQAAVQAWLARGRVLVRTPGAGVADEFNNPTTLFDTMCGITGSTDAAARVVSAAERGWSNEPQVDTLTIRDARFGGGVVKVRGPVAGLTIPEGSTASVAASGTTENLITVNQVGGGYAIAYGFFPGWVYWLTPERGWNYWGIPPITSLPSGWGAAERLLAAAPVANLADTPKSVAVSVEGVEARVLSSSTGVAIVLFNWTGDAQVSSFTIQLQIDQAPSSVTLASGGVLAWSESGGLFTAMVSTLVAVDVVMLGGVSMGGSYWIPGA